MIVIFRREADQCGQLTYEILQERGARVVIIDGGNLFSGADLGFSLDRQCSDSFFTANGRRVPYSDITAVLVRGVSDFHLASDLGPQDQTYFRSEMAATFDAIQRGLPCPVFNRLSPQMTCSPFLSGSSASLAVESGFQLPDFIATASIEAALDFYQRQDQRGLLDSLLGSGVFLDVTGPTGRQILQQLILDHAICLAERPEGPLAQCVVVADQVFAADSAGREIELSSAAQGKCRRLADALELPFLMLTTICSHDGRDYCLDINPQPLFPRWERHLQERIAVALADALEYSAREVIVR